jgi:tight adherence protein C
MSPSTFAFLTSAGVLLCLLALGAVAVTLLISRNQRRLQQRAAGVSVEVENFAAAGQRPLLQGIARQGRAMEQLVDADGESARLLIQAGWRDAQARMRYYLFQGLVPVAMVGLLVFGWLFVKSPLFKPPLLFLLLLAAAALALLVPRWVLRAYARGRQSRIRAEVPLFVHLLVLLYDAGLSTRQAFSNLVREGGNVLPEIGREIQLVLRQVEAGGEVSEVLRRLGEALEVGDLTTMFGVLRQVDRYGGEIREPLLDALKVIEERSALELREKVNIMSARMTVVMVLFFFPALLIFTAGPATIAILKTLGGIAK